MKLPSVSFSAIGTDLIEGLSIDQREFNLSVD